MEGSEPFRTKNLAGADVPRAVKYIREHRDYTAYHLLFALRDNEPDANADQDTR